MQQLTRHNSCVEFSFLANGASSNTRKLTRLNGLFHYLADRKTGGIRADKLHDLILKAGLCELKCQRLEAFLFPKLKADNVEVYSKEKVLYGCTEKTKVDVRVISRGPFLAVLKDEPMHVINSLMQAIVSSKNNKNKKSKKKKKKPTTVQFQTTTPSSIQQPQKVLSTNLKYHNDATTAVTSDSTRSDTMMMTTTKNNISMSVRTETSDYYWNDDSIRNNSPRSSATDLTLQNTVDQYTMQNKKKTKKKKKRSKRRSSRKSNDTQQAQSSKDYRHSSQHSYIVYAHNNHNNNNNNNAETHNKQGNHQVFYGAAANTETNMAELQSQEFYENRMHRQHRQCHSDGPNFLSMDMTGLLMKDLQEQQMMQREKDNDICDILSGFTRFIQNIGGRKDNVVF